MNQPTVNPSIEQTNSNLFQRDPEPVAAGWQMLSYFGRRLVEHGLFPVSPRSLLSRWYATGMDLIRKEFPNTVRIETTSHCNADCTFCPRDSIGRDKSFMDDDLFHKIIDECAQGGCRLIHLHNFGEPLLDNKLPERIRYAKDAGISRVKIFTNGSLLKGEMARRLLDSGLDEIKVSIDGANAQEFNELRIGLDHAETVNNTRKFRQLRDERRDNRKPTIVAACTVTSDDRETAEALHDVVDWIEYTKLHNWAGGLKLLGDKKVRKPCDRLWRTFTILASGDVSLCCLDYSGQELMGNVRQQTVSEVWNSDRYNEMRDLHRNSEQEKISLCKNCTKCFY